MQAGGNTIHSRAGTGSAEATAAKPFRARPALVPAALLAASGFLLFAREDRPLGFLLLAAALIPRDSSAAAF